MAYNIIVMPAAYDDIDNIYVYISETLCAPTAASNLLNKLLQEIHRLKDFPLSGELQPRTENLKWIYRRLIVDNYIIFYTLDEKTETVYIMRILYGASNYINLL